MKLLFDQNLSHKLVGELVKEFPGSAHVRDLGLTDGIVLGPLVSKMGRATHYQTTDYDDTGAEDAGSAYVFDIWGLTRHGQQPDPRRKQSVTSVPEKYGPRMLRETSSARDVSN